MRKVAVFMGTRPEAIKMAPVVRALLEHPRLQPVVVSTGQHKEMLQQVVDLFGVPVHHELSVMQANQTLAGLTSRLVTACDAFLADVCPDFALVQGDTTTVLAASLCSFYRGIPVGHVEAGLRTGNLKSPFPEEANRVLATRLASLHFAPTESAKYNLLGEHVPAETIFVTGNTVIDALQLEIARQTRTGDGERLVSELAATCGRNFDKPFVLITGHRRENFGGGFVEICEAIADLAATFGDVPFVYPVHLNPNVRGPVHDRLGQHPNVALVPPQPYSTFVALMSRCRLVLTDSGGVQEEAPSLGKPVLVMRDTTERPEGVEAQTVRLVGAQRERIVAGVTELLLDQQVFFGMARNANPYGDGNAAPRIVDAISDYLKASS